MLMPIAVEGFCQVKESDFANISLFLLSDFFFSSSMNQVSSGVLFFFFFFPVETCWELSSYVTCMISYESALSFL